MNLFLLHALGNLVTSEDLSAEPQPVASSQNHYQTARLEVRCKLPVENKKERTTRLDEFIFLAQQWSYATSCLKKQ
jgi:hypothetical protein